MKVIVYEKENLVRVVYPNLSCGLTIEEIAAKDTEGCESFIVDSESLPIENQRFWTITDGVVVLKQDL